MGWKRWKRSSGKLKRNNCFFIPAQEFCWKFSQIQNHVEHHSQVRFSVVTSDWQWSGKDWQRELTLNTFLANTENFHALDASFLGLATILSHVERKLEVQSCVTWLPRLSIALLNFCSSKGCVLHGCYPFFSSWNPECMCLAKTWMPESAFTFHRQNDFMDSLFLQIYMEHKQCWEFGKKWGKDPWTPAIARAPNTLLNQADSCQNLAGSAEDLGG